MCQQQCDDESDPECLKLKLNARMMGAESETTKLWTMILTSAVLGIIIMNVIVFNDCQKLKSNKKKSA
eukprot:CAMPEP_0202721188 /NCGR_PEP_ID=MMETSP1385-20130828/146917_1 /ASSEMBLY_ACC=CAM_ASM_000861 /TAXON_ID=933848 /ORGANISM="Elphidium margaritaceum" /LENGTH=67 /DNA_ID=CAMNT_0049385305 /DNA_START=70 /DNA_END=269 /DNA_ORIENTATION=+